MTDIIKTAKLLCSLPSASGREFPGHEVFLNLCSGYFDEYKTTPVGSYIGVIRCGKPEAGRIMLDAHLDQVGMMVTNVYDDGFLTVTNIGGIDTNVLSATRVKIYGKETINGVIVSKPPHLQEPGEQDKKLEITNIYIDTGITGKKIKEIVNPGDIVLYDCEVEELSNGLITGKAFDDRICIIAILHALDKLDRSRLESDIYCVFSGGEEIGYIGVQTSAYEIAPDVAVVLDVCTAEPPEDARYKQYIKLNHGGAVSISPTISRRLAQRVIDCAERNNLKYQIEPEPGRTGTNAHALQISREGIPTAIISLPLRYMHTPSELISVEDIENVSSLLAEFIIENGGGING